MAYYEALVVLLLLAASSDRCLGEKGSCRAARKCCDGKDADCVSEVRDLRSFRSRRGRHEEVVEPCYCDHGCLEVGDCCPDFKDYCGGNYTSSFFLSFFFFSPRKYFPLFLSRCLREENNYANHSFGVSRSTQREFIFSKTRFLFVERIVHICTSFIREEIQGRSK